jgi:hypothetical protein
VRGRGRGQRINALPRPGLWFHDQDGTGCPGNLPCDCPQVAGDGPRPVRAGCAWPLVSGRRGVQRLRRSRGGS